MIISPCPTLGANMSETAGADNQMKRAHTPIHTRRHPIRKSQQRQVRRYNHLFKHKLNGDFLTKEKRGIDRNLKVKGGKEDKDPIEEPICPNKRGTLFKIKQM